MSRTPRAEAVGPAIAFGVILLLLAGAALLSISRPPELDGRLENWRPKPAARARIEEIRAERKAAAGPEEPVRKLTAAWRSANAARWLYGPSARNKIQIAEQRFKQVATDFIAEHGLPAYAAAGEVLAGQFIAALDDLAAAAGDEHKGQWLTARRRHPVALDVRALGGEFPERGLASGLLAPKGPLDPDRRLIARILWTTHWFEVAQPRLAREAMFPEERLLVRLWKVEDSAHLSWRRRRAILEEVTAATSDYPVDYVLGVLAVREGLPEEAETCFRRALAAGYNPDLVRRWLTWLAHAVGS